MGRSVGSGPLFCTSSCFLCPSSSLCYTSFWFSAKNVQKKCTLPEVQMKQKRRAFQVLHFKCPSWRHGYQTRYSIVVCHWAMKPTEPSTDDPPFGSCMTPLSCSCYWAWLLVNPSLLVEDYEAFVCLLWTNIMATVILSWCPNGISFWKSLTQNWQIFS